MELFNKMFKDHFGGPTTGIDLSKVENIEFDGVDHKDYPDYCDAFISYAEYEGKEMADEQLDELMGNYPEWVNSKLWEWLN